MIQVCLVDLSSGGTLQVLTDCEIPPSWQHTHTHTHTLKFIATKIWVWFFFKHYIMAQAEQRPRLLTRVYACCISCSDACPSIFSWTILHMSAGTGRSEAPPTFIWNGTKCDNDFIHLSQAISLSLSLSPPSNSPPPLKLTLSLSISHVHLSFPSLSLSSLPPPLSLFPPSKLQHFIHDS